MLYNVSKLNIPLWIIYIIPFPIILILKMEENNLVTALPSVQTLWGLQHSPPQGATTDLQYFLLKPVWFAMKKKKSSWSVLLPQLTTRWKSFSIRCLFIRKSTNEKKKIHSLFPGKCFRGSKGEFSSHQQSVLEALSILIWLNSPFCGKFSLSSEGQLHSEITLVVTPL